MLTHDENMLLCRVEGDAPMGQLMRRHWLPACLAEEVKEPDGNPVKVKLLGEDLVAFRDTDGRVGVIDEYCPHRRASLLFGRNEECGLRCLYHGWKIDVDGNVVEMASEPPESRLTEKVKHKSYPVREAGGFVWVYMGPADEMPEFQPPAFAPNPTTKVSVVKIQVPCNWAQILEGAIDSAHSSSLHSSDMPPARVNSNTVSSDGLWQRPSTDKAPRLQVQLTNYGFRYAAIRRPIFNAQTHDYVRITAFVAPIMVLIPPNNKYSLVQLSAPQELRKRLMLSRIGSGLSPQNNQLTSMTSRAGRLPKPARAPKPPAAKTALSRSVRNLSHTYSVIAAVLRLRAAGARCNRHAICLGTYHWRFLTSSDTSPT